MKDKLARFFSDFLDNLIFMFQGIWDEVFNQPRFSQGKIMNKINFNLRGPFFWVYLKKDERLIDFSKGQFAKRGVEVVVQKGEYRLERKIVKWGENLEMPWLVLENTTIGAREAWWQNHTTLHKIVLKSNADA